MPPGHAATAPRGAVPRVTMARPTPMSLPRSRPLPEDHARTARRLFRRMARIWSVPAVAKLKVVVRPDLSRTLGRFSPRTGVIEVSAGVLAGRSLAVVLVHEAAHAAVSRRQSEATRPHGPEWRALMALAGEQQPRAARWCAHRARKATSRPASTPSALYDHRCPVCHHNRKAKRPVRAWRCAACVAAGLEGQLEITRRTIRTAAHDHR